MPGLVAGERVQQRLRRELGEARCRGHAQRRLRAAGQAHRPASVLGEREDLAGGDREPAPARGQLEHAAGADVEVVAELAAQRSDRARNRRLADLERAGGCLDAPKAGDGQEGPELR